MKEEEIIKVKLFLFSDFYPFNFRKFFYEDTKQNKGD